MVLVCYEIKEIIKNGRKKFINDNNKGIISVEKKFVMI